MPAVHITHVPCSSLDRLASRGVGLAEERGEQDQYYKGIMSTVRTVSVPELSDEAIQAARDRRKASAPKDDITSASDLEGMALPSNHPFFTKKAVTPEEEEAKRKAVMKMNAPRRERPDLQ